MSTTFDSSVTALRESIDLLKLEYTKRGELIDKLQTENKEMSEKFKRVQLELADAKQYSKLDNLVITGIPATYSEIADASDSTQRRIESNSVTVAKVVSLCQDQFDMEITHKDISTAHRLRARKRGEHPPIIVRFVQRSMRDEVYRSKKMLKTFNESRSLGEKIFINEDLIDANHDLLRTARYYKKKSLFESVWTAGCKVFVKPLSGPPQVIKSINDLRSIIHHESPGEDVHIIRRFYNE